MTTCPYTHDTTTLILSSLLLVGVLLSYIPQLFSIFNARSSFGLSPWFLCVGNIASICTAANIILLQSTDILCCLSTWPAGTCFEQSLGVIQLCSQSFMMLTMLMLYMVYFPQQLKHPSSPLAEETAPLLASESSYPSSPIPESDLEQATRGMSGGRLWLTSQRIAGSVLVFLTVNLVLVPVLVATTAGPPLVVIAAMYGAVATLMSCIQFIPQIVHTFYAKDPGALSILTMSIQTPGTFLLIVYLASIPSTNLSTYLSYIVSATSQGILLFLSLYYKHAKRGDLDTALAEPDRPDSDLGNLVSALRDPKPTNPPQFFPDSESLVEEDDVSTPTNVHSKTSAAVVCAASTAPCLLMESSPLTVHRIVLPVPAPVSPVGSNVAVRAVSPDPPCFFDSVSSATTPSYISAHDCVSHQLASPPLPRPVSPGSMLVHHDSKLYEEDSVDCIIRDTSQQLHTTTTRTEMPAAPCQRPSSPISHSSTSDVPAQKSARNKKRKSTHKHRGKHNAGKKRW